MEKKLHLAFLFWIQLVLVSTIFASGADNNHINGLTCDAPAPDSFRITNTTSNSISLAWQPALAGALHTLEVLEKDPGGGWEPIDTIFNLPGTSYTVSGLQFGQEYRFIIATNCQSGEPSVNTSIIDGIVSIIELVLGGRTPINPTVHEGCPSIDYLAYNWVGFKIESLDGGALQSNHNYFEFKFNGLNGGLPKSLIKRVIYGPAIVAGDYLFVFPEDPIPQIVEIQGSPVFRVFRIKGPNNINPIGVIELTLDQENHTVKFCKAIGEPWNNNYIFSVQTAQKSGFSPTETDARFDTSFNMAYLQAKIQCPINDNLNIIFSTNQKDNGFVIIQLFDIKGTMVFESRFSSLLNEVSIPVESLPNGIYIIKIQTNYEVQTKKVIKSE